MKNYLTQLIRLIVLAFIAQCLDENLVNQIDCESLMQETERPVPGEKFRQGDILRFEGGDERRSYSRGVIINADCDLENNKLDGVIAYLPLYSFEEYLEHFWIKQYVDQVKNNHLKWILDLCGLDSSSSSNQNDIVEWLSYSDSESIATKLIAQHGLKSKELEAIKVRLDKLRHCVDPLGRSLTHFHVYCSWEKDPAAFALKQLIAAKNSMGDDHFFLSEVLGEREIGFVVRMRRIYTINVHQCFTSTSAQLTSSDGNSLSAVRIAKLTTLFQFKIAQIFALQYSRIGLPNEMTALNNLVLDTLAVDLSKSKI